MTRTQNGLESFAIQRRSLPGVPTSTMLLGSFQVIRPRTISLSGIVKERVDLSEASKAKLQVRSSRGSFKRRRTARINTNK